MKRPRHLTPKFILFSKHYDLFHYQEQFLFREMWTLGTAGSTQGAHGLNMTSISVHSV